MSGNENHLTIILGKHPIATLSLSNDQLQWRYMPNWQASGYAVSPHLPLNTDIPSVNVQRFLQNLLPEGPALEELIQSFRLSRTNTFALVRALGFDTPGSLVITPRLSIPQEPEFRLITKSDLEQRLMNRDTQSLIIWDGKPRLSVAGVQEKINILINDQNQIGFGEGALCSTHILKFEKQRLSHLVLNEFVTMQLAQYCGLNVAKVDIMRLGLYSALLVERFDRKFISMSEVKRRHIIDGCQALNLSPDYKYERNFGNSRDVAHVRDGASLKKIFAFADQCMNPALTKQQLIDWVLFNILVFNYDAHGKNISFFVGSKGMSLTPFYDLVNIKLYPEFEQELAMAIGDEFESDAIKAYQLADFADSCRINRSLVAGRLQFLIKKLRAGCDHILDSLSVNEEEETYLRRYRTTVLERCMHLQEQLGQIASIEL